MMSTSSDANDTFRSATWFRIAAFVGLTAALSVPVQIAIVRGGGLASSIWLVLALMWCPGIAAIIVHTASQRTIQGLGWKLPPIRLAILAYVLPIAYSLPVYALVWMSGIATIVASDGVRQAVGGWGVSTDTVSVILRLAVLAGGWSFLVGMLFALGEEIGWRGFLVPELSRVASFNQTALSSGVIWAVWHYPLLIWADYNNGLPPILALACFTLLVVGISFAMAWTRLRSQSLWPAVILHASHNAWIQTFFTPITSDSGTAKYWIDEFGMGMAASGLVVGLVFAWLAKRHRLNDSTIDTPC